MSIPVKQMTPEHYRWATLSNAVASSARLEIDALSCLDAASLGPAVSKQGTDRQQQNMASSTSCERMRWLILPFIYWCHHGKQVSRVNEDLQRGSLGTAMHVATHSPQPPGAVPINSGHAHSWQPASVLVRTFRYAEDLWWYGHKRKRNKKGNPEGSDTCKHAKHLLSYVEYIRIYELTACEWTYSSFLAFTAGS